MSSIVQNHPESNTKCYKVAIPYGNLHLVVDGDGSRWTSLAHLADLLHLQMHTLVDKTDKKYWMSRCFHLPSGLNGTCIPIDRITSLLDSIKDREVVSTHRTGLQWLRANAYGMLNKFQAPIPVVPLLDVEPEPAPVKVPAPAVETGLQTFNFGAAPVRAAMRDDDPWFVAKDVCGILGLDNTGQAIAALDSDDKAIVNHGDLVKMGLVNRDDLDITRLALVSEGGLYSLIFKSTKAEAKAFKRWITHEVLPAIRKTGSYGVQAFHVPQTLREALLLAADQQATIEAHQATISTLAPKAVFTDRVTASKDAISIREFAKVLGDTGQNRFYQWLRSKNYLTLNGTEPYQRWVDQGIFIVIEKAFEDVHGLDRVGRKTLITGKGQVRLQGEWDQDRQGGQAS